jgi:hypothetical protein
MQPYGQESNPVKHSNQQRLFRSNFVKLNFASFDGEREIVEFGY